MALLVDGPMSTIEDLRAQDSGVLEVSHGEGVDLTAKLEIARAQIEIEIESMLRRAGCGSIGQVVATAGLKRWHVLKTLAMTYRDAYFSQLNDRYRERWRAYDSEAHEEGERLMETGVGMATNPLPRPGPVTVELPQGVLAPGNYWVRVSWMSANGEESEASRGESVAVDVPHSLVVRPGSAPAAATGWNVYVGRGPGLETKQNAAPLELGSYWAYESGELDEGAKPGEGQKPDFHCARRRLLRRG